MNIIWSVPVFSEGIGSGRGDMVRARALIEALRARGHRVGVVEARDRPGRRIEESVHRSVASRFLPDRTRGALRDAALWWRSHGHGRRVARSASDQEAEILVETQVHGVVSGSIAARATGLPLVLDDVSPPAEARRLGHTLPALGRRAFDRQRSSADLLVTPSREIFQAVHGSPTSTSGLVIPNGVDLEAHSRASRRAGRRTLGVDGDLVIGFAGSFQPWHAADLLVRAVARLGAPPPVRLLLLGDGAGRERALAEAGGRGIEERVVAPGSVPPDRVPEFLAGCDVGVLPGTNEYGHPMKLLEYGAAGLPIVAPDVQPVRALTGEGLPAVLFKPGDAASLTDALERLVEAPGLRRRLGADARRWVGGRGSGWTKRAESLEHALEGVLRRNAPPAPAGSPA